MDHISKISEVRFFKSRIKLNCADTASNEIWQNWVHLKTNATNVFCIMLLQFSLFCFLEYAREVVFLL